MRVPAAVYRALATLLPALLGQGLIYLCIAGKLDIVTAVAAILSIGAVTLTAAATLRTEAEARLVRSHGAPAMFTRGAGAGR